jgi:hypothetical protein
VRVYVFQIKNSCVPPRVFSTLAKAKRWGETRVPFARKWVKVEPTDTLPNGHSDFIGRVPEWRGFIEGDVWNYDCSIQSIEVDQDLTEDEG